MDEPMNKIEFDGNAILNHLLNAELLKAARKLTPLMQLLNKYGIYGTAAASFLIELGAAMELIMQQEENDG